jgi:hypothetical protein
MPARQFLHRLQFVTAALAARSRTRAPTLAAAALALAGVAAAGASQADGLAFSDGFESGNASLWSQDGFRDMCTVVTVAHDGGKPHSGRFMAECNWNGTVDWLKPNWFSTLKLPQSAWNYSREFLVRVWVRFDADVTRSDGDKILRLFPGDGLDSLFLAAAFAQPTGPMVTAWEHVNGQDGPTSWGKGTRLGDMQWHQIQIYVKHNTPGHADGVHRVWLDGQVTQESVNIVSVAPGRQWGPLYLMSNWENKPQWAHGATNHAYWDDIEVYTDQSSGGVGMMSDASIGGTGVSAPNAPKGVTVR